MDVLLVKPRGFCAGVDRAVEIVELALKKYAPPIYVRREIVHNATVVNSFKERGVIFVNELEEVPDGQLVVFSAHGISPAVREEAERRRLRTIDATCPLVTKVHTEVHRFVGEGNTIALIGHAGHDEVEGTMGESPQNIVLVTCVEDVEKLEVPDPEKLTYLTQTTLSVDETIDIVKALKQKFPKLKAPPKDDICYATQNRQNAMKELVKEADIVLVVGAENSSNAQRLREVAEKHGARSYLIPNARAIKNEWLEGAKCVGITSGASAPEVLVEEVVEKLKARGAGNVRELEVMQEHVRFPLPLEVREVATVA